MISKTFLKYDELYLVSRLYITNKNYNFLFNKDKKFKVDSVHFRLKYSYCVI